MELYYVMTVTDGHGTLTVTGLVIPGAGATRRAVYDDVYAHAAEAFARHGRTDRPSVAFWSLERNALPASGACKEVAG